jgi:hypothetical protein
MANVTINSLPTASTIDATNDLLPIYTNSLTATQSISRNTYLGLSSAPAGLTDTQTLTNKTLTSPTINGATLSGTLSGTYTIGGTPTFPSSVTQNTVVQTLTNKTLTSPTINSPTITNATISADTLTGYTVSNTGTIYGVPITTGTISATYLTASTITNTQIAAAGLYTSKVYNPYKFSVYRNAALNTGSTTFVLVPFDTKTFDTSSNVDITTNVGRFTAPVAGFYFFCANVSVLGITDTLVNLYKNGTNIYYGSRLGGSTANTNVGINQLVQLSANDYIEVYIYSATVRALDVGTNPIKTWFSGYLVSAT